MFISMHMIAALLDQYQPEIHIQEGNRSISTVRIIADEIHMSSSTVYLNQASPNTVVCANGPDYIIVPCDDINIVLNSILDAFEFYNDWANDLTQKIREGCSLEEVLKAGNQLLQKYMVLADPTFLIYQTYGDERMLEPFPAYAQAITDKMLPMNVLMTINKDQAIRVPDLPSYEVPVPSMGINTIVTNLFSFTKHNGWLITNDVKGLYTTCEKDLQDAFAELLQMWMAYNEQSRKKTDRETVFRELLDGKPLGKTLNSRLEIFHWYPGDEKQIYVIEPDALSGNPLYTVFRMIENLNPLGFVFFYEEKLIYIVNRMLLKQQDHDYELKKLLLKAHCVAGKSAVFTELEQVRQQYEAAKITASYAVKENLIIADIGQIIIPYLRFLLKDNSALPIIHPAIEILKKYDKEHQTELNKTLRSFLRNQLNYTKTTEELYIHRSTLLYRIARIKEMIQFDPDDYEDVFLLEMSFLMDE